MEEAFGGYVISEEEDKRIGNNFTYHAPFGDQAKRYELLRERAKGLAKLIMSLTPKSREQSLALTKLEDAIMWANASIARNEKLGEE